MWTRNYKMTAGSWLFNLITRTLLWLWVSQQQNGKYFNVFSYLNVNGIIRRILAQGKGFRIRIPFTKKKHFNIKGQRIPVVTVIHNTQIALLNTNMQHSIPWPTDSSTYPWTKLILRPKSTQSNTLSSKTAMTPN